MTPVSAERSIHGFRASVRSVGVPHGFFGRGISGPRSFSRILTNGLHRVRSIVTRAWWLSLPALSAVTNRRIDLGPMVPRRFGKGAVPYAGSILRVEGGHPRNDGNAVHQDTGDAIALICPHIGLFCIFVKCRFNEYAKKILMTGREMLILHHLRDPITPAG